MTETQFEITIQPDCPYWLDYQDGRWRLYRRSHPEIPGDHNVDFVDCEIAFEQEQP